MGSFIYLKDTMITSERLISLMTRNIAKMKTTIMSSEQIGLNALVNFTLCQASHIKEGTLKCYFVGDLKNDLPAAQYWGQPTFQQRSQQAFIGTHA
jgi:hypothetical protein